jgi:hypothetical protein
LTDYLFLFVSPVFTGEIYRKRATVRRPDMLICIFERGYLKTEGRPTADDLILCGEISVIGNDVSAFYIQQRLIQYFYFPLFSIRAALYIYTVGVFSIRYEVFHLVSCKQHLFSST